MSQLVRLCDTTMASITVWCHNTPPQILTSINNSLTLCFLTVLKKYKLFPTQSIRS